MSTKKLPLSQLPLPPVSRWLQSNLTADPVAPNVTAFHKLLQENPSVQRRARLLDKSAHFSYVTPLPLPFPFRIEFPEEIEDKKGFIEDWLSFREATERIESAKEAGENGIHAVIHDTLLKLGKYTSDARIQERELLGVVQQCAQDCFPQLDIGDSLEYIGKPALTAKNDQPSDKANISSDTSRKARQELLDILSGHTVLASYPSTPSNDTADGGKEEIPQGYAPWSLRYSGHQFGQWAGQLGDGRAISIMEVYNENSPSGLYEIQLKGAGRTPFSRSADGLAVLRSSIREYLAAEHMAALGVPTTRSLSLTSIPSLPVQRETMEFAAVVSRVAPSFLRIGNFQALNPPEQFFFLGGGQQEADLEALRVLGEYVSRHVLQLGVKEDEPWGEKLVMEVARRNALMVAGWQAYGFMHGVINTDNVSILGLTIDYGPYAFMDVFESGKICNHSDDSGRYSYKLQPTMIIFALRALLSALAPVIGAERAKGKSMEAGWTNGVSKEQISEWTREGLEMQGDLEKEIMSIFFAEYPRLMRRRLGLKTDKEEDFKSVISPLLDTLEKHELDYPSTFRSLSRFQPDLLLPSNSIALQAFIDEINTTAQCSKEAQIQSVQEWKDWLSKYSARIEEDQSSWIEGVVDNEENWIERRRQAMDSANPRFILRQWILEEVIAKCEKDPISGRRVLAKVLEMASRPFERWGKEGEELSEEMSEEVKEERRYCELGERGMLGFQCSCSS